MRSFIAALLVALMLIGGAVGYSYYVDRTAEEMHSYTDRIDKAVLSADYPAARALTIELSEIIDRKKEVLGAIADHQDLYDMQRVLAEMVCLIEEGDIADCRAHCAAVAVMIERLSGNSSPAIFNIL